MNGKRRLADLLTATGALVAGLPPYVVGLGVLLGIAGALGAMAFL